MSETNRGITTSAFSDGLDRVALEELPLPEPGPGQVRVRMRYAPINPSDVNHIDGTYYHALERVLWNQGTGPVSFDPAGERPAPQPPYVLGSEGMGTVEAAGGGLLARRLIGKRVAVAGSPVGTWQTHAIIDARRAIPVPASVDDQQAAMFFVNPLAAVLMLREVLAVPRGAWLLQTAAGSALGQSVVRLSKRWGFRTINVVRSDRNVDALKSFGADEVVVTSRDDLRAEVHRITGGTGVPYAIDCVGGELAGEVVRCLGMAGHMLLFGTLGREPMTLHPRDLMMPMAKVEGFFVAAFMARQSPLKLLGIVRTMKKLHADGFFASEVARAYPMADYAAALAAATGGGSGGKVLLDLG